MVTIKSVKARQIFDGRGNPAVEVEVTCSDGSVHRVAVPFGASTVIYEALELRDGSSDYLRKGVLKLGANAIMGVSLGVYKASAVAKKIPFYKVVIKKYGQDAANVGDEGGFAPNIQDNKEVLELLNTVIAKAGYTGKVVIGIDVAATEFYDYKDRTFDLNFKEEDPFDQYNWEHYVKTTVEIGEQVQIIGDGLLMTNPKLVEKAIKDDKKCNLLLLKVYGESN